MEARFHLSAVTRLTACVNWQIAEQFGQRLAVNWPLTGSIVSSWSVYQAANQQRLRNEKKKKKKVTNWRLVDGVPCLRPLRGHGVGWSRCQLTLVGCSSGRWIHGKLASLSQLANSKLNTIFHSTARKSPVFDSWLGQDLSVFEFCICVRFTAVVKLY